MALPAQPLDDGRLAILAEELLIHTRAASANYNWLRTLIGQWQRTGEHPDGVTFWTYLQSFLTQAGMVSKFINPVHKVGKDVDTAAINEFRDWRAAQIRRLLVGVYPAALDERLARNFLEHIDENL